MRSNSLATETKNMLKPIFERKDRLPENNDYKALIEEIKSKVRESNVIKLILLKTPQVKTKDKRFILASGFYYLGV